MIPYYQSDTATLYCGDCLEVMPQLAPVGAILADLPFGRTDCVWDSVIPMQPLWEQYRRLARGHSPIVLFAMQPFTSALVSAAPDWFRWVWIWHKPQATDFFNARKRPLRAHEDIAVFAQRGALYHPQMRKGTPHKRNCGRMGPAEVYARHPPRKPTVSDEYFPRTVLDFPVAKHDGQAAEHPTQKPESLLCYLAKTHSDPGQVILDNTMGTGATGVAAIRTGRRFIGIEKDARYCEIALRRIREAERSAGAA